MNNDIKTLLVSPHPDDIAISIGGALLQDFFMKPIMMVTIFTKSNYSPKIKTNNIEMSSKIRQLEDIEFISKVKIDYLHFEFSEPPLRGYSHDGMFKCNEPESDPLYEEIYNSLSKLIRSYPFELIVSPIGLGNHIDHIMTCDICFKIARENNIKIIFYEELPYASFLSFKQIKIKANSISQYLQPIKIDITSKFNEKINNIKIYKSQLDIIRTIVKLHALQIGLEKKGFKQLIYPDNLYKFLMCFFIKNYKNINLFERIWVE